MQMLFRIILFNILLHFCLLLQADGVIGLSPMDSHRINEISKLLETQNTGYGLPYYKREVWDRLYKEKKYKHLVFQAEELLSKPYPEWSDSLYLIFSKKGLRPEGERMMIERRSWLPLLVWAECLENKGRFIKTLEKVLVELCEQPTWVLPAHDWYLENFRQTNPNVDLASAGQACELAQALFLLNDKIDRGVYQKVVDTLFKRVFTPVLRTVRSLDNRHYWLTVTNNWNSVCIAGVTAAALAIIPEVELRAEFVAMAEKYSKNGIIGYRDDGYCVEGLGYYNYGFGNYILLREAIWKATGGKLDLFNNNKIVKIATFGIRSEINNGVYPAIADCRLNTAPSPWLLWYLENNLKVEMTDLSREDIPFQKEVNLLIDMLVTFTESTCSLSRDTYVVDNMGLRSYFEQAGLLIARPRKENLKVGLSVAIKGGTNGESHNHNDVGSYTIICGNEYLMGDPGGPSAYTNKTFTKDRYTLYKAFSSWGHPVPLIDGNEQFESSKAQAIVQSIDFSNKRDCISYEISSSYKVEGLKSVLREFIYNRTSKGSLVVVDSYTSEKPIEFETALTTRYKTEYKKGYIKIIGDDHILKVHIKSKIPFEFKESKVSTYGVEPYIRIGIRLLEKSDKAYIKMQFTFERK